MKIQVNIECLVLEGLPLNAAHTGALEKALRQELAQTLVLSGLSLELRGGGMFPSVRAPGLRTSAEGPAELGRQIARSIHSGIAPQPSQGARKR
jgi:hypothetical protein